MQNPGAIYSSCYRDSTDSSILPVFWGRHESFLKSLFLAQQELARSVLISGKYHTTIFLAGPWWWTVEKRMAPHSSILAWRIPRTDEPGGLPSIGSQSPRGLKRLSACMHSCEGHPAAGSVPSVTAKMPSSLLYLYPSRVCVSQLEQDPSYFS